MGKLWGNYQKTNNYGETCGEMGRELTLTNPTEHERIERDTNITLSNYFMYLRPSQYIYDNVSKLGGTVSVTFCGLNVSNLGGQVNAKMYGIYGPHVRRTRQGLHPAGLSPFFADAAWTSFVYLERTMARNGYSSLYSVTYTVVDFEVMTLTATNVLDRGVQYTGTPGHTRAHPGDSWGNTYRTPLKMYNSD